MKTKEQKIGWIRTMLNQILFVWAYWFFLWRIFDFLNSKLFKVTHWDVVGFQPLLVEILTRTIPLTWHSFTFGLTPFLVGAVWCRHNRFYQKMTENSLLVKAMWSILVMQSALIVIDEFLPVFFSPAREWNDYMFSRMFCPIIFIVMWAMFSFRCALVTRGFTRNRKENPADWRIRVGRENAAETIYVQLPIVSTLLSVVFGMFLMFLIFKFVSF